MHYQRITRVNPKSGNLEKPWRNREHFFVLGDPSKGGQRHHDENAIKVDNYGEALELVCEGYSIRMSDGSSPPNLVVPSSLTFEHVPFETLDELWTYTMPELPFTETQLEDDLRMAIVAQAAEIQWVAGQEAASAFAGFAFDIEDADDTELASKVKLERFNLARVVKAAFESAYRTGQAKLISDDDIDELEILIGATFGRFSRRYGHPCSSDQSPLARTMLSAYARWLIGEDQLFGDKLDHSAVERLALLADMTEAAVRNSLAKEKLSALKGKADYAAIVKWLEGRRDFVPLREDERVGARATWAALHDVKTQPIGEALARIAQGRPKSNEGRTGMGSADSEIIALVEQGSAVPAALLRTYARNHALMIDTWTYQFPRMVAAHQSHNGPDGANMFGAEGRP